MFESLIDRSRIQRNKCLKLLKLRLLANKELELEPTHTFLNDEPSRDEYSTFTLDDNMTTQKLFSCLLLLVVIPFGEKAYNLGSH